MHRELAELMGGAHSSLNLAVQPPAVILMAGLQGASETTTTGKLGKFLKERMRKKVIAASADVYRPAAIQQLKLVTEMAGIDFFPTQTNDKPAAIASAVLDFARSTIMTSFCSIPQDALPTTRQ
ncbi:MAG: hypothetical protein M5R42_13930 [Rhodocyclaceae bacterium]|nr:hypothetical protein [Rhodocyclaceae bacterium]